MIIEVAEGAIGVILGVTAIISALIGAVTYWYKRGKKAGIDQAESGKLEDKIDSIKNDLDSEKNDTNESHKLIHKRIDKCNDSITQVGKEVASSGGKLDVIIDLIKKNHTGSH